MSLSISRSHCNRWVEAMNHKDINLSRVKRARLSVSVSKSVSTHSGSQRHHSAAVFESVHEAGAKTNRPNPLNTHRFKIKPLPVSRWRTLRIQKSRVFSARFFFAKSCALAAQSSDYATSLASTVAYCHAVQLSNYKTSSFTLY